MTFNNTAVNAVFNAIIDNVSYTEALMAQGIGDKATARPYALTWASGKYNVKLVDGQRGLTLDANAKNYETARKAVQRVLEACFPSMELDKVKPAVSKQVDEVAKLLKAFEKLTPAQRKKFIAAI